MSNGVLYGGAIGLSSGIIFRSLFLFEVSVFVWLLCALTAGALLFNYVYTVGLSTWLAVLSIFLCFSFGVWYMGVREKNVEMRIDSLRAYEHMAVAFLGTIARDIEERDGGQILVVRVRDIENVSVRTLIRVQTEKGKIFSYGDTVRVSGVLKRPESFETELGRVFLYEKYLRAEGITHMVSFATVAREPTSSFVPLKYLFALKHAFLKSMQMVLPEPQAGFAAGLLLGEKHALGEKLERVFRDVGIIHIIVLSGYNLTIVAESVMRLLSIFFVPKTRALIGVAVIILFAIMVGLSATVVRAACMACLVLIARATGRISVAMRGLMFAGIAMVLINPYVLVYDPGFQLSFLATIGLIVGAPVFERYMLWVPTRLQIREYVTATLATQLFVTPFILFSMGSVSLVALLSNILVLIAVPFAMFASFVAGVWGMLFSFAGMYIAYPAHLLLSYMIAVAEFLASFSFASITVPPFSFTWVVVAYLLIGCFFWYQFLAQKNTR